MKTCSIENCNKPGAFATRTKPTWCIDHLQQIYALGGLTLLSDFTKPSDYLLTKCNHCGFEAHYKFEYILANNQINEPTCRACHWKQWAEIARNDLNQTPTPVDIHTIKTTAQNNGYKYLKPLTNPTLTHDPHAIQCTKCGNISAKRPEDLQWGCTCQRNPKTVTTGTKYTTGANLLKNSKIPTATWWDKNKNTEELWEKAKIKSRFEAWWTCPQNHSFRARVLDVTGAHFECPECRENRRLEYERQMELLEGKTIADVPELLVAWDEDIPPEFIMVATHARGSGYKFRCAQGHRTTRQPISWLRSGCSACRALETKQRNLDIAQENPNSSRLSPEISSQWHPTKNGNLKLASLSPDSRRTVWWKDPICGHEFEATPRERDKYQRWRCPICKTVLDSLAYHYPEIAQEWSPKNQISPWEIRPNTTALVDPPIWCCKNDPEHEWQAMPSARVRGRQCPHCRTSGKSLIELAYVAAAKEQWGNALSGHRVRSPQFRNHASWEVDVFVELPTGQRLVVEYDGSYWHRDKAEIDREKTLDLLGEGYKVIRLRESPLSSLEISHREYLELVVYSGAQELKCPGFCS